MSLPYAILGILNYAPMSGYDLKKTFDGSLNLFWPAQTSQIYRELGHLEKQAYVTYQLINQEDKPDKKIYSLTPEGRNAFQIWLEAFPEEVVGKNPMLMHLFFASILDKQLIKEKMEQYYQHQKEKLETLKTHKVLKGKAPDAYAKDHFFWQLCALKGHYIYEANMAWAAAVIEAIDQFEEA